MRKIGDKDQVTRAEDRNVIFCLEQRKCSDIRLIQQSVTWRVSVYQNHLLDTASTTSIVSKSTHGKTSIIPSCLRTSESAVATYPPKTSESLLWINPSVEPSDPRSKFGAKDKQRAIHLLSASAQKISAQMLQLS